MESDNSHSGLTARETAERLGVEVATVYAYASRGSLSRRVGPDGRRSRYDPDEVELLARKGRPRSIRRSPGAVDVVIGTTISQIGDGWIRYRGHGASELAATRTFEDVAQLLWSGELPDPAVVRPSSAARTSVEIDAVRAASRAAATLGRGATPMARLVVGAAAASSVDPFATGGDRAANAASVLMDALLSSLEVVGTPTGEGASVAARLWARCSPLSPTAPRIDLMNQTLVLLAEHELATSTLAVRVAASTGAGLAHSLLAGLGTLSGPLHGGAASRVHRRLRDGATNSVEGFGHMVHVGGDPRFEPLMAAVSKVASASAQRTIETDLARFEGAGAPRPNVDAALGALGFVARAEPGATDAIFAVARMAGWCAHAIEEADELPLRYRGRTLFRGPKETLPRLGPSATRKLNQRPQTVD